jgi:hypothetical protein
MFLTPPQYQLPTLDASSSPPGRLNQDALKAPAAACVVTLAHDLPSLQCGLDEFGCIVQLLQRRCYAVGHLGGIVLCLAPHGSGLGVGGMFADDAVYCKPSLTFGAGPRW